MREIKKDSLEYTFITSIEQDYLSCAVITSKTQALLKSQQISFGSGKSTLAMQLAVRFNNPDYKKIIYGEGEFENWKPSEDAYSEDWDRIFGNKDKGIEPSMCYNPCDLRDLFLEAGHTRTNLVVLDDGQYTMPRTRGIPRFITMLVGEISASRPEVANLVVTTPNILSLAAPLRGLPDFELIVSQRGIFEVQRTLKNKDFRHPEADLSHLVPVETGTFSDLPKQVKERYNSWRVAQKRIVHSREYQKKFSKLQKQAEGFVDDKDPGAPLTIPSEYEFLKRYREAGKHIGQSEGEELYRKLFSIR